MKVHGGNIYETQRLYGVDSRSILDYSANINPLGVPGELRQLIVSGIDALVNYPDPDCTDLKRSIAQYLMVDEESIIIGNGASEVIFLLFDVLRLKKVLIPSPTFAEYARAAEAAGSRVEYFRLREEEDYRLDVGRLTCAMDDGADAVFLCNPNNPTSRLVSVHELLELLRHALERKINIFIDEAFIEMTAAGNAASMARFLKDFPNLFIIRAFTKIFAIPGLRLGYGLGNNKLVSRMWERKLPWSVNSLACSMGGILSSGAEYMGKTREWLITEKDRFCNELEKIKELKVYKPETNFILLKIKDGSFTAEQLKHELAVKGIMIRDAGNFTYLDESYFRVAVKDRESNGVFLEKLKEAVDCLLKKGSGRD